MLKLAMRLAWFCLFLGALTISPWRLRAAVVEQLITVIDGEPYTLTEVGNFSKSKVGRPFPTGDLNRINEADREVLEHFITDKLIEAETREAGIRVTDADVDQYIEQVKRNNRLSEDDFKTILSRENQTLAAYKISVKSELEKSELINRAVKAKINITNEDIERYYKANAKNYRAGDRARIRHILLSLPENANPEQVKAATELARDLYQRIKAGEDFAKLATEYSQGGGRNDGGDIGWVNRGTLIGGLEDVAFQKLSVGQVSEPFRTSMGIHIVKLEGRETGTTLPLSAVAPKIKEELYAKAVEERFAKWMKTDLRRKHRIDVKLAGISFKPEESKEGTMDSLMAKSNRPQQRTESRSFISYLNPMTYISKEIPFDDDDPKSPLYGKSIVTIFGMPLYTKDTSEDVPDILNAPVGGATGSGGGTGLDLPAGNSSGAGSSDSGFFSGMLDTLNPFSSKKP